MKKYKIILEVIICILVLNYFGKFIIDIANISIMPKGINAINENYKLDLPENKEYIEVYNDGIMDMFLFEKLIYNEEDTEEIITKLNNHDKDILDKELNKIYERLTDTNKEKYKENFKYNYKEAEEVYFYTNNKKDREIILIYDKENKILYHLSNAIFE